MSSITDINLGIAKKLRDKGYFQRFFKRRAQGVIASQIRELREKRNFTQTKLAKSMKTGQSAIARIEDANYSGWSFTTLLRVAEILDARLKITFQPMEDVIQEYERRDAERGKVPNIILRDTDKKPEQDRVGKNNVPAEPFARRIQDPPLPPKNSAHPLLEIEKPAGASFENLETPGQERIILSWN